MYNIRRVTHTDDKRIERTEPAKRYDKVLYENVTKLMYRRPDNSTVRYWVGNQPDDKLKYAEQVFIMNKNGKTIEVIS